MRAQVGAGGGGAAQRPATQPQQPQSDLTFGQVVQFLKAYKVDDADGELEEEGGPPGADGAQLHAAAG
eukprot:8418312-Pyramimonas_sp.AAC.1